MQALAVVVANTVFLSRVIWSIAVFAGQSVVATLHTNRVFAIVTLLVLVSLAAATTSGAAFKPPPSPLPAAFAPFSGAVSEDSLLQMTQDWFQLYGIQPRSGKILTQLRQLESLAPPSSIKNNDLERQQLWLLTPQESLEATQ